MAFRLPRRTRHSAPNAGDAGEHVGEDVGEDVGADGVDEPIAPADEPPTDPTGPLSQQVAVVIRAEDPMRAVGIEQVLEPAPGVV